MKITGVRVDTSERVAVFVVGLEESDTLGDVLRVANAIEAKPVQFTRADHVHPVAKPEVSADHDAVVAEFKKALGGKAGLPDEVRLARALETIEELRRENDRLNGRIQRNNEGFNETAREIARLQDEVERLKDVSDDKDEQITKLNDKVDNINDYSSQMENLYMALREALRIDVFVAPEVALTRAKNIEKESRRHPPTVHEARLSELLSENAKLEVDGKRWETACGELTVNLENAKAENKRLTSALESLEKSYADRMAERDDADLKGNALRKEVERLNSALTERDATCGKLKTSNDELAARLQEAGSVISQQNSFRRAVAMAVGLGEAAEPSTIVITIDKLVAERDRLKVQATVPAEEPRKPIPSGRATFCSCTSITRPLEKDGATYCSQCGLAIPVVVKLAELPSNGRGGANG